MIPPRVLTEAHVQESNMDHMDAKANGHLGVRVHCTANADAWPIVDGAG